MTETTQPIEKTPFYDFHVAAGAKMVEFAGFMMPVQYRGITAEHLAVRNNVGLFDLSHMGEFEVSGDGALEFLQGVTTNNVAKLEVGRIQYSCLTNTEGGIVDDLLVYRMRESYLLVVNAANRQKDLLWLQSHLTAGAQLKDRSTQFGLLAIQGPKAQTVMARLTEVDLDSMAYYSCTIAEVGGINLLFSRTGYTGEDGFEIYVPPDKASSLWQAVTQAGSPEGMELVGLGARDSLRLEMRMALYGNDMDEATTPVEAGISWAVDLDTEFIGRDAIARQKEQKPTRRLVCLELEGRAFPRRGHPIFDGDKAIGTVTSGTFSPSLKKPIALGYVLRAKAKVGSTVEVEIRNNRFPATVVKPPFYKHGSHK